MAERSFGDGSVYLERLVPLARHIEVQVFGLGDGQAVHIFERECSIQRRFQKIVEESPAPGLTDAVRGAMADAAVALCRQERYAGAGTIEFVVDGETGSFYFLEMNTRIQVEHPVTEMVTGLDLVDLQISVAARDGRGKLSQTSIRSQGHAIEARVYNDDWVDKAGHEQFLGSDWKLSSKSDRTGFRLEGPKWTFAPKAYDKAPENGSEPSNIIDQGYPLGAINVAGHTPINLVNDGPSMGGFICPCTVPSAAFWKLGQSKPGKTYRFAAVAVRHAQALARQIGATCSLASIN